MIDNATFAEHYESQIDHQNIIEDPTLRAIDGMIDAPETFDWVSNYLLLPLVNFTCRTNWELFLHLRTLSWY